MPSSTEAGAFTRWAVVDEEIRDLGEAMPDENTGSDSITIAIPVSQLISLPVLVPVDDRTVAEGVAMTELEDLGTRTPLTGSQISHAGYIPYSQNGTDPQRGWGYGLTVVPALPEGEDIHYAPSPPVARASRRWGRDLERIWPAGGGMDIGGAPAALQSAVQWSA